MAYTQEELNYYKDNPEEITGDLDPELIMELIDFHPANIKRVPQTVDLIERAYARDPQVFKHMDFDIVNPSFLDAVIEDHPTYLRYIYYPSPELVMRALELDLNAMPFVDQLVEKSMFEWTEELFEQLCC